MSRNIDADALIRRWCGIKCGCERDECGRGIEPCIVVMAIEEAPTIDRPQGEWIDAEIPLESGGSMPIQACNLCKTFYPLAYTGGGHRFCPNCGARMIRQLDAKIVANGNCALCGKPLSDGRLFVCKECEEHIEEGADDEV